MRSYWQAELTDFRGNKTLFKFKFSTRFECERFIDSQRKPNMRAVEIVPEDPRVNPEPEPIDRDPGDEAASVEGDDDRMTAAEVVRRSSVEAMAELTRQRKCAALAKARAAKAAKRAVACA